MIFDSVIGATRQELGNCCPFIAQLLVFVEDHSLLQCKQHMLLADLAAKALFLPDLEPKGLSISSAAHSQVQRSYCCNGRSVGSHRPTVTGSASLPDGHGCPLNLFAAESLLCNPQRARPLPVRLTLLLCYRTLNLTYLFLRKRLLLQARVELVEPSAEVQHSISAQPDETVAD